MIAYLDTHTVIALRSTGQKALSKRAESLMNRATELRLSPAAVVELQMLREIGRLHHDPFEFVGDESTSPTVVVCREPFAGVMYEALGLSWTRDPFDRLIVAQAAVGRHPLITKDERIRANYDRAVW